MVSAYSKKDVHLCRFAQARGIELEGTSFDEFVARTTDLDHAHLRPQVEFLFGADGEQLVDFVGRWESLGRDFEIICARLGIQVFLGRENASERCGYRDYYSDFSRKRVETSYQEDIDAFGYAF
jgi:hypothetical protein